MMSQTIEDLFKVIARKKGRITEKGEKIHAQGEEFLRETKGWEGEKQNNPLRRTRRKVALPSDFSRTWKARRENLQEKKRRGNRPGAAPPASQGLFP